MSMNKHVFYIIRHDKLATKICITMKSFIQENIYNITIIIIIMIFNQGAHISEEFFNEALDKIHKL